MAGSAHWRQKFRGWNTKARATLGQAPEQDGRLCGKVVGQCGKVLYIVYFLSVHLSSVDSQTRVTFGIALVYFVDILTIV